MNKVSPLFNGQFILYKKKDMYETKVIIIPVGKEKGRKDLEFIENRKFDNKKEVEKALYIDENSVLEANDLKIYSLSDFMDVLNNQDADTLDEDKIDIGISWFGYIQMRK